MVMMGAENQNTRLYDLAVKYAVDKLYRHSYIPFYTALFAKIRVQRILEIGIGYEDLMTPFVPEYVHGASLKMWREYWPNADVFACDIRPDTLVNEGRIRSCVCDQSSKDSLGALVIWTDMFSRPMDVIIDDGSHQTEHQVLTAQMLLPFVRRGGVYVIEDVMEPERVREEIGDGYVVKFSKCVDDNLVVIEVV